jgi:predicted MFS family arabinose efflux permease
MTDRASSASHWRNAGTLITCVYGLGTASLVLTNYAMGAFVYPLTAEYGWSRRDIMLAATAMTMATVLVSFLAGWLTDRLPPRKLIVPSQIAFGLSFGLLALFVSRDLWTFYALHIVLAVVALGCLPVAFSSIVAATFVRNRGLAFGVMLTGSGLCGVLIPPYLAWLIDGYGWRIAYAGLGLVPTAGALLLSLPLLPAHHPAKSADPAAHARDNGVSLQVALRDRRLWTIALSLLLGSGLSTAVVSNFVPLLRDQGITSAAAAGALSSFGVAVIVGRLIVGWLIDRFWAPPIALAVMIPAAIALVLLGHATTVSLPLAYGCAIFLGLAAGAEGDMLSYLGVRYFGLANAGKIYGFVYIFFTIGIGIGGPVFGAVYDAYHTYRPALYGGAIAWIVCGALLLTLGAYPSFEGDETPRGD